MTHLVSPISFRAGKTHAWKSNSNPSNILDNVSSTTLTGIDSLLMHKLRRKRLYLVKSSISLRSKRIYIHSLFMPRIKMRPVSQGLGSFSKFMLYKDHNRNIPKFQKSLNSYVDERRLKIFRFPQDKYVQINKWITRRMFRGSNNLQLQKKFKLYSKSSLCGQYTNKYYSRFRLAKLKKFRSKYKYKIKRQSKKKKKLNYNSRWWRSRLNNYHKFNVQKLSHSISNSLNQRIDIRLINIFYFMAAKQMIGFRSHQEHFWNRRFRRFRFQYDNYYDIVNSFFVLGLIKNSENLLLSIIRMMMPRIRKIRRFMYFLDAILKNMPQVQANFSSFRITITGKTQGGTKRTKTFSIGFGHLPYQTIYMEGTNAFISYPHLFGEFGIKLVMNRTYKKLYKGVSNQWLICKDPSPLAYILEPEKKSK